MTNPSNHEQLILNECQEAIGYTFKKQELLKAALTHTSGANTRTASNERLEFLGDSVLGLITCERLFLQYPDFQEGDMTKVKSVVVSRKTCAKFSAELGLGNFLFMGRGLTSRGEISGNIMADVFESLVAAIYLDADWETTKEFVLRFIGPEVETVAGQASGNNAKSELQQVAQREFGNTPRYLVLDEQGPDHDKCFKVSAEISGHRYHPSWGRTKKEAEIKAALNCLAEIEGLEIPHPTE